MDFADLYDVRPGEIDFLSAIKRLKEKDNSIKHLDKEYYIEFIKQQMDERKKYKNTEVCQVLK